MAGSKNERAKLERRAKAVAQKYIVTQRDGGAFILTLPTNPRFRPPNKIDRERGVVYADFEGNGELTPRNPMQDELAVAQAAMVYQARELAIPTNLKKWVKVEARKVGGNVALASALVKLEPDTVHAKTDQRNMLRKVEEWAQGKYTKPSGRNKRRVAAYVLTHARHTSIGVTGHWWLKESEAEALRGPLFRRFNTQQEEPRDRRATHVVLLSPVGEEYVYAVELAADRQIGAYSAFVEIVCGLHCEVEP